MSKPICLRPRHLLCTQGYEGRGYSEEFVCNMTAVVRRIRTEPDKRVKITYSVILPKLPREALAGVEVGAAAEGKPCYHFCMDHSRYEEREPAALWKNAAR